MIKALACKNKNSNDRMNASSGGVFILLAREIIHNGGVVYGASFDDTFSVVHVRVTDASDLDSLCRSKYAFSAFGNAMNQCEKDLKEGRRVLFVGSPCQVSALNRKLGRRYENLVSVDFVCHGAPSAAAWKQYLNEISAGKQIKSVNFRDKCEGWLNYHLTIEYDDGTRYSVHHKNEPYMRAFIDNSILSEGCYSCRYKGIGTRESDITLGDYWGADTLAPEFYDEHGISLVLIHSQQGQETIEKIASRLESIEVDIAKAIAHNPSIVEASQPSILRRKVKDYERKTGSLYKALRHYYHPALFRRGLVKAYKIGLSICGLLNGGKA